MKNKLLIFALLVGLGFSGCQKPKRAGMYELNNDDPPEMVSEGPLEKGYGIYYFDGSEKKIIAKFSNAYQIDSYGFYDFKDEEGINNPRALDFWYQKSKGEKTETIILDNNGDGTFPKKGRLHGQ